jgi:hydroxymethylpyrimidine pyrophosphatase-like HAD family hydrolase
MNKKCTLFCDIDGTLFKYRKFGTYQENPPEIIENVKEKINQAFNLGHCIILTTARPESIRENTITELKNAGILFHQLVMDLARGTRILINDKEDELINRAYGINLKRDQGFNSDDLELLNKILF